MPHSCSMGHLAILNVIGEITETTLVECPSCGWIGRCERGEDNLWMFPDHKRLMAADEDSQMSLPDRLKIVFHGSPGYVCMESAAHPTTHRFHGHTYAHWEITSVRYRPQGFHYWSDDRQADAPKITFIF